ncbi:MAG: hypothetical protein HY654_07095 [Acidobacteria bacterium]|nr:hypothetical protein [Acidobacteriota bacterium]
MTRHDPKTLGESGGPITHDMSSPEVYATVFALGPGKTDVNAELKRLGLEPVAEPTTPPQ